MQKKHATAEPLRPLEAEVDPAGCPFREFRDTDLGADQWGAGPELLTMHRVQSSKHSGKISVAETLWRDDQVQPLPRSARTAFAGWVRAEDLALSKWNAGVVVCKDGANIEESKMRSREVQYTYADVFQKSSFCRQVLECCYLLERLENYTVEHQWENFICAVGPDGWLPRLHILSPGMKPGGGPQHRPTLSRNGCYLVRLFFLGAWRCVWVSDMVPVDAKESPLLPFACPPPPPPAAAPAKGAKQQPQATPMVVLWPILICKALLKIAAPDMSNDEGPADEQMTHLDIMHCLTGSFSIHHHFNDPEAFWVFMQKEVPVFAWPENSTEGAGNNAAKSKAPKKPAVKETLIDRRKSMVSVQLVDTLGVPSYELAGLTPAHEIRLLTTVVRDLPLVKPPDEPEVPLWKTYRWLDWARSHGLYDEYECPRMRFLKANGLLRMSYAPHMLNVRSNESIAVIAKDQDKVRKPSETPTQSKKSVGAMSASFMPGLSPSDLDWFDFMRNVVIGVVETSVSILVHNTGLLCLPRYKRDYSVMLSNYLKQVNVVYFPSMHQFFSAGSHPPQRPPSKNVQAKPGDLRAPIDAPLYLQVDSDEAITLRVSLSTIHPRILSNAGNPQARYIKPAYLFLEKFEWLSESKEPPVPVAYLETRSYESMEVHFPPGRHYFRIWVNSALMWHCSVLSEASLVLCRRDVALSHVVLECPWATNKLTLIGSAFAAWTKMSTVGRNSSLAQDFYKSYAPDFEWDAKTIGHPRAHLHWMFSQALQGILQANLAPADFNVACSALRRLFLDPNFGLSDEIKSAFPIKKVLKVSRCDCSPEEVELASHSENRESIVEEAGYEEELIKAIERTESLDICRPVGGVHCGELKGKLQSLVIKHNAAVVIQSHWRRVRCERLYRDVTPLAQEGVKIITDLVFGTSAGISGLMNTFFKVFPGARAAYSVSSGLGGAYDLQQHAGAALVSPKDTFVPLFSGIFYCHSPARVHFDLDCLLRKKTMVIYDKDTGNEIPTAMNTHMTYNFERNIKGFAVHGHAWTISDNPSFAEHVPWKLTVLTSEEGAFHVCDHCVPTCTEISLNTAVKLDMEEMYLPNRQNILGAVQLFVINPGSATLRVGCTDPELKIEATLRSVSSNNEAVGECSGLGELFWPHIGLEPPPLSFSSSYLPGSAVHNEPGGASSRNMKPMKKPSSASSRRSAKGKRQPTPTGPDPKLYEIEVIAPNGWPLTSAQWMRVDEVQNPLEVAKPAAVKRLKHVEIDELQTHLAAQAGDASFRVEVSLPPEGGVTARRHPGRDQAWAAEQDSWEDRTQRHTWGALVRDNFRTKYLVPVEPSTRSSSPVVHGEQSVVPSVAAIQEEVKSKSAEEIIEEKYLTRPECVLDQFQPLPFLPICTKELTERTLVTEEAAAAATHELRVRIEAAHALSDDLQRHNVERMLGRQRRRNALIESVFVDSTWRDGLARALLARDEALPSNLPKNTSLKSLHPKKK